LRADEPVKTTAEIVVFDRTQTCSLGPLQHSEGLFQFGYTALRQGPCAFGIRAVINDGKE
jgi:hypothetical protein